MSVAAGGGGGRGKPKQMSGQKSAFGRRSMYVPWAMRN